MSAFLTCTLGTAIPQIRTNTSHPLRLCYNNFNTFPSYLSPISSVSSTSRASDFGRQLAAAPAHYSPYALGGTRADVTRAGNAAQVPSYGAFSHITRLPIYHSHIPSDLPPLAVPNMAPLSTALLNGLATINKLIPPAQTNRPKESTRERSQRPRQRALDA